MSLQKAEQFLQNKGFLDHVIRLEESTATVVEAAEALGVEPFGVHEGIAVYLDESLKAFDTVYPAAGDDHSAVKLTIAELEQVCDAKGWVDVCKAQ